MTDRPTIYLAGKVGGRKWDLAAALEDQARFVASDEPNNRGVPVHVQTWAGHGFDKRVGVDANRAAVSERTILPLAQCSAVLGYLDRPDCFGSIAELAYAAGQGRSVRAIVQLPPRPEHDCPDPSEWASRCDVCTAWHFACSLMHDAYWFVTSLPAVLVDVVDSFDAAVAAVRNWLSPESPMEAALQRALEAHGVRPVLQYRVGTYRLDFAFPEKRVGVEVDGHAYHSTKIQRARDAQRDRFLAGLGWAVLRFTGTEVYQNPTACAKEIASILASRRG